MAEFILLAALLFFAALSAASETSLIATSRLRLRRLSSEGSKTAKLILTILETPERFFGTILVVNNIVDTLIASLITAIVISLVGRGGKGVAIATIIASFLIIVAEVAAKTLAARHSERLSLMLAVPVKFLIRIFSPVVRILEVVTNWIIKILGGDSKAKPSLITDEEIRMLIKIGAEENVVHKEKYRMLSRIFDFSDTIVRNVMTQKKDMVAFQINANLDYIVYKALESGYSRFPIYSDSADNIVGIINMKDLLNLISNRELVVLHDIIYPPITVSGSKKVAELLKEFQKGHTHMAIVSDDHGKIEGLVTIEDLLEEIVGEIQDEYDVRTSIMGKPL